MLPLRKLKGIKIFLRFDLNRITIIKINMNTYFVIPAAINIIVKFITNDNILLTNISS